jgi:hypothetical protein
LLAHQILMMSSLSSRLRLIFAWSVAAILRDGRGTDGGQSVGGRIGAAAAADERDPALERIERNIRTHTQKKRGNQRPPRRGARPEEEEEAHHIWPSGAFRARSWCE